MRLVFISSCRRQKRRRRDPRASARLKFGDESEICAERSPDNLDRVWRLLRQRLRPAVRAALRRHRRRPLSCRRRKRRQRDLKIAHDDACRIEALNRPASV